MAAPPLVFDFIGIVFTAILYGFYCLLFGLYWRIQLTRADRWKNVFFYALIVNFILCTAFFIDLIIQVQFNITETVLNTDSLDSALNWLIVANNALYTAIDLISQLILLYRCWIMWRQPLVMVLPCILSFAFLAIALTANAFNIIFVLNNGDNIVPDWYYSIVTAFFFISLGVNALVTALIVYKIVSVYHDIRKYNSQAHVNGHLDVSALISILIESGLITFAGQLVQSVMYKFATDAFLLVSGVVVMLYGISMTAVLVRVMMGISCDQETTRTMNSMNLGRPIELTPSASKANPSQITKVE